MVHAALGLARRGQSDRHVPSTRQAHDAAHVKDLPDKDLAYLEKARGTSTTTSRGELGAAVRQDHRDLMMKQVIAAARQPDLGCRRSRLGALAVKLPHNYGEREHHFG